MISRTTVDRATFFFTVVNALCIGWFAFLAESRFYQLKTISRDREAVGVSHRNEVAKLESKIDDLEYKVQMGEATVDDLQTRLKAANLDVNLDLFWSLHGRPSRKVK